MKSQKGYDIDVFGKIGNCVYQKAKLLSLGGEIMVLGVFFIFMYICFCYLIFKNRCVTSTAKNFFQLIWKGK